MNRIDFRVKFAAMQLAVQAIRIFGVARIVSAAFGSELRCSVRVPYSVLAFRARAFLILIFELKQDFRISCKKIASFTFYPYLYKYFRH